MSARQTAARAASPAASTASTAAAGHAFAGVTEVLRSPGQSLEASLRGGMEQAFAPHAAGIQPSGSGSPSEAEADRVANATMRTPSAPGAGARAGVDFSHVRLHTGRAASASAQLIGARAYTAGSHVVFDDQRASLTSAEGRHTLAHELTHVVQRVGARPLHPDRPRPVDGMPIARKEEYPLLHQEMLQSLIKIMKAHKIDGPDRVAPLVALAKSVPEKDRSLLLKRLSKGKGEDQFTDFVYIQFPKTRGRFLEALALGHAPEPETKQETVVVPPKPAVPASKEGSTFVTYDFKTVKDDPQYIDNFTNSGNEAWFPNERVLILQYPNGSTLRIGLADVIKALDLKSDLNPGFQPSEQLKKQVEEGEKSGDLVLPRIKGDKDGLTVLTVENQTSFHRDGESKVIYPQRTRIPKAYLPRLANLVEQIEAVRVNQELWMQAAPKLLEIVANMNWSAPRGMGGLLVSFGRKIKQGAQALKGVVIKPKVAAPVKPAAVPAKPAADAAKAGPSKAAPGKAAPNAAAEGMPEAKMGKDAPKPKPPSGNAVEDVTDDTKKLFERRPDLKKALEKSPRAAQALKKCASPCFPESMSNSQIDRLERLLEDADEAKIFYNDKQLTSYLRSKSSWQDMEDGLNALEKDLMRKREVLGELDEAAKKLGRDYTPEGQPGTVSIRATPGKATGGEKLPDITDQWFPEVRSARPGSITGGSVPNTKDVRIAQIPGQVARKLRGGDFKNFDDFRERFWKLVAQDPVLKQGWTAKNLARMNDGLAPFTNSAQRVGGGSNAVYQLNHKMPLKSGGDVYSLDNIEVASPRFHGDIGPHQ